MWVPLLLRGHWPLAHESSGGGRNGVQGLDSHEHDRRISGDSFSETATFFAPGVGIIRAFRGTGGKGRLIITQHLIIVGVGS